MKHFNSILAISIILLSATACSITRKQEISDSVRLVTYNVGVFKKSGSNTTGMVASMMKEVGAQVISMNELDSCTARNPFFQIKEFAEQMGDWGYNFAPAIDHQGGKYGEGISYSRDLNLISQTSVLLGQEDGAEDRVLAVCEFEKFIFCSAHLDHRSENARNIQASRITEYIKKYFACKDKPVFLCGDLNAYPESKAISILSKDWTLLSPLDYTFPAINPNACIDYVFVLNDFSEKVKVKDAKILTDFKSGDVKIASDHLPVYLEIEF